MERTEYLDEIRNAVVLFYTTTKYNLYEYTLKGLLIYLKNNNVEYKKQIVDKKTGLLRFADSLPSKEEAVDMILNDLKKKGVIFKTLTLEETLNFTPKDGPLGAQFRNLFPLIFRQIGDVGFVLNFLKTSPAFYRLEKSNPEEFWKTIFLVLFPEYSNVFDDVITRDLRGVANRTETIRWKALTLWITYFHRRILKTLEKQEVLTMVRDGDGRIDIRYVIWNNKQIPVSVYADANGCYKGRLLAMDFNWKTDNDVGKTQLEKQANLKSMLDEKMDPTDYFDYFVSVSSERKDKKYFLLRKSGYPRDDSGRIYLGNNCNVCQSTTNVKVCGDCMDTKYCSVDCQRADFHNHKKNCLK